MDDIRGVLRFLYLKYPVGTFSKCCPEFRMLQSPYDETTTLLSSPYQNLYDILVDLIFDLKGSFMNGSSDFAGSPEYQAMSMIMSRRLMWADDYAQCQMFIAYSDEMAQDAVYSSFFKLFKTKFIEGHSSMPPKLYDACVALRDQVYAKHNSASYVSTVA